MLPDEFWESDDHHRDQKFYTAFCILEAACSDYAVGVELKRERRMNWACTVLYYSLVHAARLICFVKMGDFPTPHAQLRKLFSEGSLRAQATWIKQVKDYLPPSVKPAEFSLSGLLQNDRKRWGDVLEQAGKLRNDSNYEGLLISHEYNHVKITECFENLTNTLQKAPETLIPDAVRVFRDFVDSSPRKDYWYSFLNWRSGHSDIWTVSSPVGEGLYYLEASLKYRGVNEKLMTEVLTWLEELRREPDVDVQKAAEFHDNIVMSAFGMKSSLMQDFEREIQKFCQLIDRNQR